MSSLRFWVLVEDVFRILKDTNNLFRSCRGQGDGANLYKIHRMSQETFKGYQVRKGKGLSGWSLDSKPLMQPRSNEVLVKMKAVAFNFRDIYIIEMGWYPLPVKDQLTPLADGVGEVVAIGEAVEHIKVGERVSIVMFPYYTDGPFNMDVSPQLGGSLDGTLAEYTLVPSSGVVRLPDHLSWEEGAALPCAGVTAWNALCGGKPLLPGETVLTMGTGGVSLFALQFAKLFGARVIATTSSESKMERLRQLGADEVINYVDRPDWHQEVMALTGGEGAHHIIEVGGAGTLARSIQSLHYTGELNMVGWLDKEKPQLDLQVMAGKVVSLRRIAAGHRRHHMEMSKAINFHRLKPVIDRVFPFEQAKEAYAYFLKGQYLGKVIVTLS
jgi:NADPH:quinone reductase-like Zn-dependent oxidoreductase